MVLCLTLYQRPLKLSLFLFYHFFLFILSGFHYSVFPLVDLFLCITDPMVYSFQYIFFSTLFFISIWFFFVLDYPENLLGFSHKIFLKNPNFLANPVLSYTIKTSNFSFFINSSLKCVIFIVITLNTLSVRLYISIHFTQFFRGSSSFCLEHVPLLLCFA